MIDLEKLLTISKRLRWSLLECVGQTLLCVDSMRCVAFCNTTPLGPIHDICYLSQLTTLVRYSEHWRASGTVQFDRRSMGRVVDGEEWLSSNLRSREKGTPHNNTQNIVLADLLYTEVTTL